VKRKFLTGLWIAAVIILMTFRLPLWADVGGTILGAVTDSSGAVIPGAKVTLSNPNTGLQLTVETNASGSYEFLTVQVGSGYVVQVQANGFDTLSKSDITLLVNQKYTANFRMRVGGISQKVNVSADAIQVETSSSQLGDVISASKMTAVPLNGRSFVDLLGLQAGVTPVSSGVSLGEVGGIVSVNGQRENGNTFLVNGTDTGRAFDNGAPVVPILDGIEEFRVITSTPDAEYGRFSGAVVNVVTKSGTNDFHGSLFDFLRNDKLDARGYFDHDQVDPLTGRVTPALPKLIQNQFGGTLGGPVVKNRLFFFGAYQGTRTINGTSSGNVRVPTSGERAGNFSGVDSIGDSLLTGAVRVTASAPGTLDQVLTQRLGYPVTPSEPYWKPGCNSTAQCVFPGAVIPQSAWSPAAKGTMSLIPAQTFSANGAPYFFTNAPRSNSGDNTYEGHLDLNTRRSGNWGAFYHYDGGHSTSPFGGSSFPGFPSSSLNSNQNASISNTYSFGSSAVNVARIGFTRSYIAKGLPGGPFKDITSYGFQKGGLGIVPGDSATEGLPSINLNQLGMSFGLPDNYSIEPNNVFHGSDIFSKLAGNHTLKFGAEFRYIQNNVRQKIEQNGVFSFDGSETGNDFADYLLGVPAGYAQASFTGFSQDARSHYFGAFAQDSWKAQPNLTINYGLRWDISQPYYDTQNRIQTFIPGLQSTVFPNAPTGWVFPGDNGVPTTISKTGYKNLAPRLGIAYAPAVSEGFLSKVFGGPGKTSIRAGVGLYYTTIEEAPLFFELGDAPFGLFYGSPALIYFEQPFKSRTSSNDPGQRFPIPPPGPDTDFSVFTPISGSTVVDPRNVLPRTGHYNLNVQRQLTNSVILSLGYVGSLGRHLITPREANPGNAGKCLEIAALFTAAGNPGGGCGPGGEDSIYSINGQTFNGTRPYSVTSGRGLSKGLLDFGGVLPFATTSGYSAYNSFQATLEKRAGALQLLAAYTYSKSLDDSSSSDEGANPYNPQLGYAISAFDIRHNFVVSYSYSIPLHFFAGSPVGRRLASGWQVTGITHLRTGLPVTLSEGGDRSLCGCSVGFTNAVDKPNYNGQPIAKQNPRSSGDHRYFSSAPFSQQQLGVPGNASRRFFYGPGANNTDAALLKNTPINERVTFEFRAEFFNVFNHAQFSSPNGDFNSSTFGQITDGGPGRVGQIALKLIF